MNISLSLLKENKEVVFEEDIDFSNEKFDPLFLRGIKDTHVKATIGLYGDLIRLLLKIKSTLIAVCAYSLEDVELPTNLTDELDIDLVSEEKLIQDNYLVLDEYILSLLVSSVPTKVVKKGAKLPKTGPGFRVLTEEEFEKEREGKHDSRWDALDNVKL